MNILAKGAEAVLYEQNNNIIKERIVKNYRIKELDLVLRKFRTRREAKILETLSNKNFSSPKIISFCDKKMIIEMQKIPGRLASEVLDLNPLIAEDIGNNLGILHSLNIVHGDLTTSNMIFDGKKVFFIDFGLSYVSEKSEDKAVDFHLLERSIYSKHSGVYNVCMNKIIEGYKIACKNSGEIFERLEKVESRGRNKIKKV